MRDDVLGTHRPRRPAHRAGRAPRRLTGEPELSVRPVAHPGRDGRGRPARDRGGHARSRCWSSGPARAVARHALRMLGGTYGRRVVVVCGKGNNGADGRVAARRLRARGVGVDELAARRRHRRAALARALGARRPRDRRDVRHRLSRRSSTARRGGRASRRRRAACRCSRSTSRRASTARPARSRGAAVRADETICFAALQARAAVRTGPQPRGPCARRRHRHRRRRGPVAAARCSTWPISRLPTPGADGAQVVGGLPRGRRVDRHGRRAAAGGPRRVALRRGHGRVRGARAPTRPRGVGGSELVARALPATARRRARRTTRPTTVLEGRRALPRARDRTRARPRRAHADRGAAHRRRSPIADRRRRRRAERARRRSRRRSHARRAAGLPPAVLTPHAGEYERLAGAAGRRRPGRGRARPRARARTRSCC